MELTEADIERMKVCLSEVSDARRSGGHLRHKFPDILVIGLCSVTLRGEGFDEMEEVGREREEWFRQFLKLSNGIPDADTFRRVFEGQPCGTDEGVAGVAVRDERGWRA